MAEHSVINDKFITQYSNLYNKVYGITGGGSNRNQETRTPDKEILVKILTVVEKPQGKSYVTGQNIQFTAREVHYDTLGSTKAAVRLFDEDGFVEADTPELFAVNANVYGIGFVFDFEKPLANKADFVNKVFSCKSRGIVNTDKPDEEYERQWIVVPAGSGGTHRVPVKITANTGPTNDAGMPLDTNGDPIFDENGAPINDDEGNPKEGDFAADSYIGDTLTAPSGSVVKSGVSIHIPNATGPALLTGTQYWADFSTETGIYYLDLILAR